MNRLYLHPLLIRIWHWTNAALIFTLILTGVQLRVPDVSIFASYSTAVSLHRYVGYGLVMSFVFWVVSYVIVGGFTGHYLLTPRDLKLIPLQAIYYVFNIFRGKPNPFTPTPQNKFNPMQKIAYSFVMLVATPVIIVSGIIFDNIFRLMSFIEWIGGVRILDAIHVITGYVFVMYLIVHIYMATLGDKFYSHIVAMITGYAHRHGAHPAKDERTEQEEQESC